MNDDKINEARMKLLSPAAAWPFPTNAQEQAHKEKKQVPANEQGFEDIKAMSAKELSKLVVEGMVATPVPITEPAPAVPAHHGVKRFPTPTKQREQYTRAEEGMLLQLLEQIGITIGTIGEFIQYRGAVIADQNDEKCDTRGMLNRAIPELVNVLLGCMRRRKLTPPSLAQIQDAEATLIQRAEDYRLRHDGRPERMASEEEQTAHIAFNSGLGIAVHANARVLRMGMHKDNGELNEHGNAFESALGLFEVSQVFIDEDTMFTTDPHDSPYSAYEDEKEEIERRQNDDTE